MHRVDDARLHRQAEALLQRLAVQVELHAVALRKLLRALHPVGLVVHDHERTVLNKCEVNRALQDDALARKRLADLRIHPRGGDAHRKAIFLIHRGTVQHAVDQGAVHKAPCPHAVDALRLCGSQKALALQSVDLGCNILTRRGIVGKLHEQVQGGAPLGGVETALAEKGRAVEIPL